MKGCARRELCLNDPSIRRVDAEHTHRAFELRIIRLYTVLRSVAQGLT